MLKYSFVLGLVLAMFLAAAPAPAEQEDINGQWSGAWSCSELPCKGNKGPMTAKIKQHPDATVTGTFTLARLCKGCSECVVEHASIIGNRFICDLRCGQYMVGLSGLARGNDLRGTFDCGGQGNGTYTLNRMGK